MFVGLRGWYAPESEVEEVGFGDVDRDRLAEMPRILSEGVVNRPASGSCGCDVLDLDWRKRDSGSSSGG